MKYKTIAKNMGMSVAKDIGSVVRGTARIATKLTCTAGYWGTYLASLPIVGSLNPSLNQSIYTSLETWSGEKDEFIAELHGREEAKVATIASIVTMPIAYGLTTMYRFEGSAIDAKTSFGIGFATGILESIARTLVLKENPGTIVGSIAGVCLELPTRYFASKYQQAKKEVSDDKQ